MKETKLPLLIGIGSRIRKSPYFDSTIKYGATGFTIYNRMYLPTAFSGPEREYNSLINDVTWMPSWPWSVNGSSATSQITPSPGCAALTARTAR